MVRFRRWRRRRASQQANERSKRGAHSTNEQQMDLHCIGGVGGGGSTVRLLVIMTLANELLSCGRFACSLSSSSLCSFLLSSLRTVLRFWFDDDDDEHKKVGRRQQFNCTLTGRRRRRRWRPSQRLRPHKSATLASERNVDALSCSLVVLLACNRSDLLVALSERSQVTMTKQWSSAAALQLANSLAQIESKA